MGAASTGTHRYTRRVALGVLGAGALELVSGCGIRMQRGAPHIPLNPIPTARTTRRPIADQSALLRALQDARRLRTEVDRTNGLPVALKRGLAQPYLTQTTVLRHVLTDSGVRLPAPAAVPNARNTPAALAAAAAAATSGAALEALGHISSANLPMLAAITAQRAAAATLLGRPPHWGPLTGPRQDSAATMLAEVRAATYALQVVAARMPLTARSQAEQSLLMLTGWQDSLTDLAGVSAPPPSLGYSLPFHPADLASTRRLARVALGALLPVAAGLYAQSAGDTAAITGLVRLQAATIAQAYRWGLRLTAFPGMAP